jgi:hypothetical protein
MSYARSYFLARQSKDRFIFNLKTMRNEAMDTKKGGKPRIERGQATLEFVIIIPLLMGLIFLALAVAVTWNSHHLSSALSLEGASLEAMRDNDGIRFINQVGNNLTESVKWTAEVADFNYFGFTGKRFTIRGNVSVPWAPFGLNWHIPVQGTTYYPIWDFNGD